MAVIGIRKHRHHYRGKGWVLNPALLGSTAGLGKGARRHGTRYKRQPNHRSGAVRRARVIPAHSRQPSLGPYSGEPFARHSKVYLRVQANPSWSAPGPSRSDCGAVPQPEAEPSRVTGATSGGATLHGAIPRPITRLATRPTQPASPPGWSRTQRGSGCHDR